MSASGKRFGCSLVYAASFADHAYRAGAISILFGSINIQKNSQGLAVLGLKVGISDVMIQSGRAKNVPWQPAFAYLRSVSGIDNAKSLLGKQPGDTPGTLISVFDFDDTFLKIYAEMLMNSQVRIVFNRRDGGIDTSVPLDLTVSDTSGSQTKIRSTRIVSDWGDCITSILRN